MIMKNCTEGSEKASSLLRELPGPAGGRPKEMGQKKGAIKDPAKLKSTIKFLRGK
jgi:hypothetical protein